MKPPFFRLTLTYLSPLGAGPVKAPFRRPVVVGNLGQEEASLYLERCVLPFYAWLSLLCTEEAWSRVYGVCGGNPGALESCTLEACAGRSWDVGAFLERKGARTTLTLTPVFNPQAATPLWPPRHRKS